MCKVPPLMLGVIPHRERAALAIRENIPDGDQILLLVEFAPIRDCQRSVVDWVPDGTPDVNDAHAVREQAGRILWKVTVYALDAGLVSLVDVDAFDWAAV